MFASWPDLEASQEQHISFENALLQEPVTQKGRRRRKSLTKPQRGSQLSLHDYIKMLMFSILVQFAVIFLCHFIEKIMTKRSLFLRWMSVGGGSRRSTSSNITEEMIVYFCNTAHRSTLNLQTPPASLPSEGRLCTIQAKTISLKIFSDAPHSQTLARFFFYKLKLDTMYFSYFHVSHGQTGNNLSFKP